MQIGENTMRDRTHLGHDIAPRTEEECESDSDFWNSIMEQVSANDDSEDYPDDGNLDFDLVEEDEGLEDSLDSLPEAEIIRNNIYIL